MKFTLILFVSLLCAVLAHEQHTVSALRGIVKSLDPPIGKSVPLDRNYELNLDLPPEQRWKHIVRDFLPTYNVVKQFIRKQLPEPLLHFAEFILQKYDTILPEDKIAEMQGIADEINESLGFVLILNLYYELHSGCTSIVAQQPDGTIIHGRNMDYGVPGLRDITIQLSFMSNGKKLFQSTSYAGYIGVVTGFKKGGFSLSIDQRNRSKSPISALIKNVLEAIIVKGSQSIGLHLRDVLETKNTYEEALTQIQITNDISTSYVIIGGIASDEGAVITKDRNGVVAMRELNVAANQWYLVETNYDAWEEPPKSDDRRTPAVNRINAIGNADICLNSLEERVMSKCPTLNLTTMYTTMMCAATGHSYSILRNME